MMGYEKFERLILPSEVAREQRNRRDTSEFDDHDVGNPASTGNKVEDDWDRKGRKLGKRPVEQAVAWMEPLASCDGPVLQLINKQAVDDHANVLNSQPQDENHEKSVALIRSLLPLGELRRMHSLPREWRAKLEKLENRFPNFSEVIDHVRVSCALSERANSETVSLDHIVLCGPPGVGKTYFATFLSRFLYSDSELEKPLTIRMADQQSNSALAGSDAFWSNAKPSLLLEELLFKGYGNPTVVLDELDKAIGDYRYDPLSALYTLWQQESAETWADLCFPWLTVDASRVVWIATCNSYQNLPAPLLSRARIFNISPPTKAESMHVAEIIAWETTQEYLPGDPIEFEQSALFALAALSPRKQRSAVRNALGKAALRCGYLVTKADIDCEIGSTTIGFV